MGTTRLAENIAPAATELVATEPMSIVVERRRVSHTALAVIQALQAELHATEARIRTEQLRLIARDTGADLATETWMIDLDNGLLERHEVIDPTAPLVPADTPPPTVVASMPAPALVPAKKKRRPRQPLTP